MNFYIVCIIVMSTMVINNHLLMVALGLVLYELIKDIISFTLDKVYEYKEKGKSKREIKEEDKEEDKDY